MTYTKDYALIPDTQTRLDEAVKDARAWLGEDRFNFLVKEIRACYTYKRLKFITDTAVFLTGLSGYPLHALVQRYAHPKFQETDKPSSEEH